MVVGGRGEVTGVEIHRGDAEAQRRELVTDGAGIHTDWQSHRSTQMNADKDKND